jgi:hypothetical protein
MAEAKAFKMIPHCTKDTITYEMDELIRCKDCAWREYDNCPFNEFSEFYKPDDDFFCADGERRDKLNEST